MKKLLILVCCYVWAFQASAQVKELSPEAIMTDRNLYPDRLSQMQWGINHNLFYWVDGQELKAADIKGKIKTILHRDSINSILKSAGFTPLKRFPFLSYIYADSLVFQADTQVVVLDYKKRKMRIAGTVNQEAENTDIAEGTHNVAFTIGNNLYVSSGLSISAVSSEADKGIVYGQSVHRNEFGIEKGTFWSPCGQHLAFYRMDERMVADYPIVNIEDPIAKANPIKYPMAGTANHEVTLGIYSLGTGKTVYVEEKQWSDRYLTNITWEPGSKHIYIAVLHRNQKDMMLNRYKVENGMIDKTLFTEKSEAYVEPLHPLYFTDKTGKNFIWQSQRDGYNHLYLYNTTDESVKQLTKGAWVVTELSGQSSDGKFLFFTATKETPLEAHVYSIEMATGVVKKLSTINGVNSVLVSSDGNYTVTAASHATLSNKIIMADKTGREITVLLDEKKDLKWSLSPAELFSIKAADGVTDLYCRLIKPKDFDPGKKYPVIVYVYGGPHAQMVSNSWTSGAGLFLHYLARQGYIVFTLDNRGSANRGMAFEQAIYKNIGKYEIEDQMQGIKYLTEQAWVDKQRIGVHGWSYGGFMTIAMMLAHPEVFSVGVAGGPVCDWKYYEIMYGERYMSTPQENPEGYDAACVINHIQDLKGKLLVIHGDEDPVVVWQHSMMLLRKAIEKKVQLDYFVYPGHEHNVGGIDRAHLMRKIEMYFDDFLKR